MMTRPLRRSRIAGRNAWVQATAPKKLAGEGGPERVLRDLLGRCQPGHAGVVDEDVEPAGLLGDPLGRRPDGVAVAHVEVQRARIDPTPGLVQLADAAHAGKDRVAGGGQRPRQMGPETPTRPP